MSGPLAACSPSKLNTVKTSGDSAPCRAFAALNGGDASEFDELFVPEGKWLGIPGSGIDGATPI